MLIEKEFELQSKYEPAGDQPKAIEALLKGLEEGKGGQVLLGATGTGKTFTMAQVIAKSGRPTLVLAHNKTLAAQLYAELASFFPENAVEYFVSYYDYYQPEAYVPATDNYIAKDSQINEQIDKLRHSATKALLERRDIIIVSSVSCIYGIGSRESYKEMVMSILEGDIIERSDVISKLVDLHYQRNDIDFQRGTFRVRGDIIDVFPVSEEDRGIRIEMFDNEIERILFIDPLKGTKIEQIERIDIYPATHYANTKENIDRAVEDIEEELNQTLKYFKNENKLVEAQRLEERTNYDLEMLREVGFCSGIENYSRHLSNRKEGEKPPTLLEYFPPDWLLVVDESHVTIPQVRAMYKGDRSRKNSLVNYGFRLPSALDNRPLQFPEFMGLLNQAIFVSATPAAFEQEFSNHEIVEQIIRPTGLLDPTVEVKPVEGQVDDLLEQIRQRVSQNQRVLVTTTTKKMSERLADYYDELGIKVRYLHSDIETLERVEIIRDLRKGKFDVLIGINLLREGLDIPEVGLVAILDADKEGFLRNRTSLIQTIGRAARNENGHVILYGDRITRSMQEAMEETKRRREIQEAYNKEHGIIPRTIVKEFHSPLEELFQSATLSEEVAETDWDISQLPKLIAKTRKAMFAAAAELDFEKAAELKNQVQEMENYLLQFG